MWETISGMTLTCKSYVQTMWSEDAFLIKKFQTFSIPTMLQHIVDTLEDIEQQQKFFNQVITGLLFLKMLKSFLNTVIVLENRKHS